MTSSTLINSPVLVLNQNYQPLNVCNARRAIVLMGNGKAEQLIDGQGHLRTISQKIPVPSVIRLIYMVKRPLVRRSGCFRLGSRERGRGLGAPCRVDAGNDRYPDLGGRRRRLGCARRSRRRSVR